MWKVKIQKNTIYTKKYNFSEYQFGVRCIWMQLVQFTIEWSKNFNDYCISIYDSSQIDSWKIRNIFIGDVRSSKIYTEKIYYFYLYVTIVDIFLENNIFSKKMFDLSLDFGSGVLFETQVDFFRWKFCIYGKKFKKNYQEQNSLIFFMKFEFAIKKYVFSSKKSISALLSSKRVSDPK